MFEVLRRYSSHTNVKLRDVALRVVEQPGRAVLATSALLERGADVHARGDEGRTPLSVRYGIDEYRRDIAELSMLGHPQRLDP